MRGIIPPVDMYHDYVIAGILLMIFVGIPLCLFLTYRGVALRRGRRESGFCINCGYDLRASSSRCSECGEQISN
jgi:hypothetical protein